MEQVTFQDLGLSPQILQALEQKGYGYPTRIQAEAIGPLMQWKDVIAKAPTGTGKTFAFGIPMIEHIDAASEDLQGLILAPTRELAIQICDELRGLLKFYKDIRVAVVYGGAKIEGQISQLKKHPQIVVATPGRLMDHYNRKTLRLDKVKTVILDEADRMLDMGFFDDVTKIIEKIKNRKNLGLFSATISQEVMTVSWMYQRDEVEITVPADQENRPDIDQYSITVPPLEKIGIVLKLLRTMQPARCIIFCNTKAMCQRLSDDLRRAGADADCLHGDIRQATREKTMRTFKDGKLAVLIATDVASRGIDVDDVDMVINYDVPEENEYYIHRIGRTGRAKKKGIAISIIGTFPEQAKLDEIAKYSHYQVQKVKFLDDGTLVAEEPKKPAAPPARGRRRFR
ncbi:MAG: DEAD/DEAH box helicase [Clostridiales bacterium]|nr:DEAD/DEAH box helicase [Bacillota bacterium]MCI6605358.1 DEAD/DEAH box helicase [Clostridiales bacterium]